MKRKQDESLETHLTKLMFKAISESEELREYLGHLKEEGQINQKSLLTFCLRPMALIEESVSASHKTSGLPRNPVEPPPSNDFNEDEWLRRNRLQNPYRL